MRAARPIFLSGFMATGKSTVGRVVATELGVPFVDTDALLAADSGRDVAELFATEGEARFREREERLIMPLLADASVRVVSFGGGVVTNPRIRHAAMEAGTLVTLTAAPETIIARVPSLAGRPNLLTSSPVDRARDLLQLRREAYAECHASIATEGRSPAEIAARVLAIAAADAVAVPLGLRSYAVELTDGDPARLGTALEELAPSSLFVVTDANVAAARGAWLEAALAVVGVPRHDVAIAPGEASKTLGTVSRLWDEALARGVDRDVVVVAFGGGVVGDLAAFVASTLLRGTRCVQVPTSLLAMVDSSVGGKTGFDHAAGKNLVGSFFQPNRVLIDIEHLATLPVRERAAGLAEVVKIALVRNAGLLAVLEREAERVAAGDRDVLRSVIREAVAEKVRVVREDERESGVRALLNLGHTLGHALESQGNYTRLLHGEAVAVGTVLEMAACERMGLAESGGAERAAELFRRLGLPTKAERADLEAAWPYVLADKKRAATAVKLPVVRSPGVAEVVRVELDALRAAVFG